MELFLLINSEFRFPIKYFRRFEFVVELNIEKKKKMKGEYIRPLVSDKNLHITVAKRYSLLFY